MKKLALAALLSISVIAPQSAQAHGIGPIDCNDWYKNAFVAVLCGVGAVLDAPFKLIDYLDEKSLNRSGIYRSEMGMHNEYTFKNKDLKMAIFNEKAKTLSDAQKACASINGRIASPDEMAILEKGASHDADILYAGLYINRKKDGTVVDAASTGWIEGIEGKDVFLYYKADKRIEFHNSQDLVKILDSEDGDYYRENFKHYGILKPVCVIK